MPYLPMKRKHDLRIIFNAILSINRTGTQWRNLDSRYHIGKLFTIIFAFGLNQVLLIRLILN